MPRTRPFSELADKIMADPARRKEIERLKLEMEALLAEAQQASPEHAGSVDQQRDEGRPDSVLKVKPTTPRQ